MNIKYGDMIKEVKKGFIIQGCNAQGKMASGIAAQIRNTYPQVYDEYTQTYINQNYTLKLGQIIPVWVTSDLCIINAITQKFYGRDGKQYVSYDAIEQAFENIVKYWCDHMYDSEGNERVINFPMIGAGLGGGDWNRIEAIICQKLDINCIDDNITEIPHCLWKLR